MVATTVSPAASSSGLSSNQTACVAGPSGTVRDQVLPMPSTSAPPLKRTSLVVASAKATFSLRSLPLAGRTEKATLKLARSPGFACGRVSRTAAIRIGPGVISTIRLSPLATRRRGTTG